MCVTQVCVVYLQCDCNSCCLHWRDVMWSRLMLSWTLSPTVTTEAPTRKLNNSPNTQLNTQPDWRVCVCVCVCVCACCKRLMCPGGGHKPRGASMRMKHTHTHTHTHRAGCQQTAGRWGEQKERLERRRNREDAGKMWAGLSDETDKLEIASLQSVLSGCFELWPPVMSSFFLFFCFF